MVGIIIKFFSLWSKTGGTGVATTVEGNKRRTRKKHNLMPNCLFQPVALETLGAPMIFWATAWPLKPVRVFGAKDWQSLCRGAMRYALASVWQCDMIYNLCFSSIVIQFSVFSFLIAFVFILLVNEMVSMKVLGKYWFYNKKFCFFCTSVFTHNFFAHAEYSLLRRNIWL